MKRLVLSAIALSMLALPAVEAQAAPRHGQQQNMERHDSHWNGKPDQFRRKPDARKKSVVRKHGWVRGNHLPSWQRKQVVRDYHRHGLRRPGYGQQWVKVDNEYLLISIASGIIAGLIAAH